MRKKKRGVLQEGDIFFIGEYIAGKRTTDTTRTTAYKTVGLAAYDLFVAQGLYRAAKSRNIGREIEL